ncbi:DNA replication/repair protein RecF [Methylovirgula sp. HY1]|uniref:DNA replication/repair protein RecF n=1 Tax=Methylovirgula sp. HY1 TaxID=2822761 RepID=UPI001C5B11E1|nr:DNA replication/repair protein RecF [Methylovirgula sp. HY1]QXX75141.1 DNA replication and repair protein RecF [Methylovirgula sp. HY1]
MPASSHDAAIQGAEPSIRRLVLGDFRSYPALDLALQPGLVVITGENGAGKTNLIEAISFLCPGRGLRRAELGECARAGAPGGWSVFVELATNSGHRQLGIGTELQQDGTWLRRYRLDREPIGSIRAFAELIRIIWLTPSMDGLFSGAAGERRRFLDRLVLAVDSEQGTRVNALERALRNRNRLLEENADRRWLDAAEHEVAELAVAVAAARAETVRHLAARIAQMKDEDSPFPHAELFLQGDVETLIGTRPALEIEDAYRDMLRANRSRDAAAGRTLIGPQAADLLVRHGPKQADAARSSTGEQKALLTGLILAHARLVGEVSGLKPIVLLDEITAHFDAARRRALFEKLLALDAQVFLTGADPAAFVELEGRAQMLHVEMGRVGQKG